ncbi:RagB/SusD family nutrient uptake outer membrane protein [Membranihabitans maritimus]|uniref:RagB/SusD family nutrient uptake outer membrane protein n=1 Tax=Membranihabitans maritimus TaxID=2904244 RepID=UPI001F38F1BF|nr:RagB/SusD family nutrient uptake outer membrane protein [Membranihabitans maritimus]
MKRLIKINIYTLIIIVLATSCSDDDFLKPEPLSFFAPENIYVNKEGFEALLITMRKALVSENTGNRDLMHHQWNTSEAAVPNVQLDMTQLTPSTDRYSNYVGQINNIYEFIKNANVAISRIDDIEWENQEDRNQILAEAYWHRSYWYYRLVHNYGDVPFIGEEVQSARLDFNTHSRWAILDKIQSDMEFAVQHLPETAIPGAVTLGAGNHLLSKIALANMDFDRAISASSEVINGPYALMTERFGVDAGDASKNVIWDLHRPQNKNLSTNTENILSIVDRFEAPDAAKSVGTYSMRTYHPAWWHSRHRDSEGNRGMIDAGPLYDSLGRGNPDAALSEWYQYDVWEEDDFEWSNTPDLRRADINWKDINEMFYNNTESVDYGEPWRLEYMTGDPYSVLSSMYAMPIYKTMVFEGDPATRPSGGNGDWYVYRLAETYLIRAEAYFWNGDLASAANDINMIRERAQAEPISPDEVTIDYIFDERARELFAETPRQNELVRVSFTMAAMGINGYSEETLADNNWYYDRVTGLNFFYPQYSGPRTQTFLGLDLPIGDKFIVIGQSPTIEPHHFLWPIDDRLINANTLGTINQNIGYAGAQNNQPPLETIE